MKLELSYIQNTQQRKAWPQRGRERVHLLLSIVVTAPVFHLDKSALKVLKLKKTHFILVTSDTSQSSIGPYVATTVLFAAPPAIQSDTARRNDPALPAAEDDLSPLGNLAKPSTPPKPHTTINNNPTNNLWTQRPPLLCLTEPKPPPLFRPWTLLPPPPRPCCVCLPTTCSDSRFFPRFLGGLVVAGQIGPTSSGGQQ